MDERRLLISPSLLSADFSRLGEEIALVEGAGADLLHVDVMDGHFVPNLTIGPFVVKAIHGAAKVPLDVHLMIDEPARYAEEFVKAGSHFLTYHVECDEGDPGTAERIRALGARPGISVRPGTPLSTIEDHLPLVDLVLVMSVEPGFGGQAFMPDVLTKVRALRERYGYEGIVEMDGGIDPDTVGDCVAAGADAFVAGSAIFRAPDPVAALKSIRERARARL
jgi:ribulose-phosphate 3-epimerase